MELCGFWICREWWKFVGCVLWLINENWPLLQTWNFQWILFVNIKVCRRFCACEKPVCNQSSNRTNRPNIPIWQVDRNSLISFNHSRLAYTVQFRIYISREHFFHISIPRSISNKSCHKIRENKNRRKKISSKKIVILRIVVLFLLSTPIDKKCY